MWSRTGQFPLADTAIVVEVCLVVVDRNDNERCGKRNQVDLFVLPNRHTDRHKCPNCG